MKNEIIETIKEHGALKINTLCAILNCDTHNIRDILHDDPCFTQDEKSFLWSYNAKKDDDTNKTQTPSKPVEKTPKTIETVKDNIMETTNTTDTNSKITLTDIIDNLNSGNKTETLKKAKTDLETFINQNKDIAEFTGNDGFKILIKAKNKSVRTKADFIEILVSYFDTMSTDTGIETNEITDADEEFKQALEDVACVTPEPVIENIEDDFKIPTNQKEYDNLLYANSIVIPGLGKIDTLDMTVQSLIKTIIRMDETIKCMENQIKNLSVLQPLCPVKIMVENNPKGVEKAQEKIEHVKTQAEILEEKRQAYIKGLKGAQADILTYFANKKDTIITKDNIIVDIIMGEEYGDYLKTDIIAGLKALTDRGLLKKVSQDKKPCFKNADKADFIPLKDTKADKVTKDTQKEQNPVKTENKPVVNDEKTPETKPKMKRGKKTNKNSVKSIVSDLLESGEPVSKKDIREAIAKHHDKDNAWINKNISASIYFLRKDGFEITLKNGIYTKTN